MIARLGQLGMLLGCLLLCSPMAGAGELSTMAQESPDIERFNPLGDFEHHVLENGMRVWIKPWPGAGVVHVSMGVPVGGDQDPEGKEGLAHYLEHVVFTAVPGKTEAEFKDEVDSRGGSRNGSTTRRRTRYWLEVPASEWGFALNWMDQLLFDKTFDAVNILRQRDPILLEGEEAMKPKGPVDYLSDLVLLEKLKPPGFIERELGISYKTRPLLGTWESLHRIKPEDLSAFYQRYYGPQNMLLTVVGEVEPEEVLDRARKLFGGRPPMGDSLTGRREPALRESFRRYHTWEDREDSTIRRTIIFPNLAQDDVEILLVLRRMLVAHLQPTLRNAEDKSIYSVRVEPRSYWGTWVLNISTNCKTDRIEAVRTEIDGVLKRLESGEDPPLFDRLRNRAVDHFSSAYQTPSEVAAFTKSLARVAPDLGERFPDLVSRGQELTAEELGAWMQAHLRQDRMIETVVQPDPYDVSWDFFLHFAVMWSLMTLARRRFARPVQLVRLRYLRKIRFTAPQWFVLLSVFLSLVLLSMASTVYLFESLAPWVEQISVYGVHWLVGLSAVVLLFWFWLLLPTVVPRKLLLFDHEWRIKFWSWRSAVFSWNELREVRQASLFELLRQGRWATIPLTLSPFRRGLYLQVGPRLGLFLRTRNDAETLQQIHALRSAEVEARTTD